MEKKLKDWIKKVFLRDLNIGKRGFLFFVITFLFYAISLDTLIILFTQIESLNLVSVFGLTLVATFLGSIGISSLIVDHFKNRINLEMIAAVSILGSMALPLINVPVLHFLSLYLLIFFSTLYLINLTTIVTHETTLLNRGRMLSYLFSCSFVISFVVLVITLFNMVAILVVECAIFCALLFIKTKYKYVETKERLKSDYKLREVLLKMPILGYLSAFVVLGFELGTAFPVDLKLVLILPVFLILFLIFLILTGLVLDNMGRKWAFAGGLFVIAFVVIFGTIFGEAYNSVFLGVSVPIIVITSFSFSGDFSTERYTLKYRGRISGVFLTYLLGGLFLGTVLRYLLMQLYNSSPSIHYWVPAFISGLSSFLLVVLLVYIMPLPEILSSREADWAQALKNLYVFNRDSICLFSKNFMSEEDAFDLPPEDLIAGGLTGILTLISEITNEKKNLRMIDKDKVKIYFDYGKYIIVALTSSKYMPIIAKKLSLFTKIFEKTFEESLTNFTGKINEFLAQGDQLVSKYFK